MTGIGGYASAVDSRRKVDGGKTYLVERFGQISFGGDMVKLDFQTDLDVIDRIFDVPTSGTDAIVGRISEYTVRPVRQGRTLIFLDEIQLDEKALNALRFFSGTGWRVIATGSLPGVTVRRHRLPFLSGVRPAGPASPRLRGVPMGDGREATGPRGKACLLSSCGSPFEVVTECWTP